MKIYQDRVVAFIDILGFSKAIACNDKAVLIFNALQEVRSSINDHFASDHFKRFEGVYDTEISSFSDSVIISGASDQAVIVYMDVLKFTSILINHGFLCRGAISRGELYHKDGLLFGKAFINTYEAESKRAIYPRIIVDEEVEKLIIESENQTGEFDHFLKSDFDGEKYIDLTMINKMHNQPEKIEELLVKILNSYHEPDEDKSIRQKNNWLKKAYGLKV